MFLVDTNVISELARPQPNPGVLAWVGKVKNVALSVITVEEIFFGLAWKPSARIQAWFEAFLDAYCQILQISPEIAKACGRLRGELQSKGISRSQADMFIAATAQIHQLTLVTRNVRDFEGCGIALLNPFN